MLTIEKFKRIILSWLILLGPGSATTTSSPCVCNALESDVQCSCETNIKFELQFVVENGLVWESNLSIQNTPQFHQASTNISNALNEIFENSEISSDFLIAQIYKFSNINNKAVSCQSKILLEMDSELNSDQLGYEFAAGLDEEGALPGEYVVQYDTIDFEINDMVSTETPCINEECVSSVSNTVFIILTVLVAVFTVFAYILIYTIWMKRCRGRGGIYERPITTRPIPAPTGQRLKSVQLDKIYEDIPYDNKDVDTGEAADGVVAVPQNDDVEYRSPPRPKWGRPWSTSVDEAFHVRDAAQEQIQFDLPERQSSQVIYNAHADSSDAYEVPRTFRTFRPLRSIRPIKEEAESSPSREGSVTRLPPPPEFADEGYEYSPALNKKYVTFGPEDGNLNPNHIAAGSTTEFPETEFPVSQMENFSVLYRQPDKGYDSTARRISSGIYESTDF